MEASRKNVFILETSNKNVLECCYDTHVDCWYPRDQEAWKLFWAIAHLWKICQVLNLLNRGSSLSKWMLLLCMFGQLPWMANSESNFFALLNE